MEHINEFYMTSNSLITHYTNMDNDSNIEEIRWEIDTTPDYNIINNIQNIYPIYEPYIRNQVTQINQDVLNVLDEIDDDDFIPFESIQSSNDSDDFIPFEPIHLSQKVNVTIENIIVSEEDKFCCICMELREKYQICQLNCIHKFCSECISEYIKKNSFEHYCPLCRINITKISLQTQAIYDSFI